ncbi:MAG: metallophosphoesterase [Salinirussus sp.]
MTADDDSVIYVISDLHVGGDEQLGEIEFRDELLSFLKRLENTDENVELVINGDAFGLWELTNAEGIEKFDHLEETYPALFEQFRATGEAIDITLIPGNHDHELAAYPAYVERFAEYNIDLVREQAIDRQMDEHIVHFEHGHQQDPNNRIENWGDPYARPLGYYYNTHVTSRAGRLSERGRFNWLKDVQAVTPTERIPVWLLSKYVYREMHPLLRYALVPFLLLFNISALLAVLAGLDVLGVWELPISQTRTFLRSFGLAGSAAFLLLMINVVVAGLLVLVAVPLYFIRRDIRHTLDRFGVMETPLTVDPESPYEARAQELFDDGVDVYCHGHTHRAGIQRLDGGLLVNSGTWLKRLHRRDGVIGLLPPVFVPSYQLFAVRIAPNGDRLAVEFEAIEKPSPSPDELTLTERFLTLGRQPQPTMPERATIPQESD